MTRTGTNAVCGMQGPASPNWVKACHLTALCILVPRGGATRNRLKRHRDTQERKQASKHHICQRCGCAAV
jgi:hypothetical protein